MATEIEMSRRLDSLEGNHKKFEDLLERVSESVHEISICLATLTARNESIERMFDAIKDMDKRVDGVEDRLPVLELMCSIVKWTALGILALFGASLGALVFHSVQH